MTKGRKGKGKQSKAVKPTPAPKPTPQLEAGRPSGQRFYDLPYSAPATLSLQVVSRWSG